MAQSRIFTEQGGNILIWSSNGDINAGKGAKTVDHVPAAEICLRRRSSATPPMQGRGLGRRHRDVAIDAGRSAGDANLIAPRGTVDAGAAGIRVSGNLNIAALQVLNAFNIQVQGVTVGVRPYRRRISAP